MKPPVVAFVANCLLNQYMRARGVKNVYMNYAASFVEPSIDLFHKYNVAIEQMPCIEVFYEGLIRKASGQDKYNNKTFRRLCDKYANDIVFLIEQYIKAGYRVCCIIGVDGSPTCGVNLTSLGKGKWQKARGIFMQILEDKLKAKGFDIPFVGARLKNKKQLLSFIKEVERYIVLAKR